MKYFFTALLAIYFISFNSSYSQEANDVAPPPPPEVEKEKAEIPKTPPKKKKKLKHCGPSTTRTCNNLEKLTDIDDLGWKVGALGAALCSKSAAIEQTRKRRRDRIEYDKVLKSMAKEQGTKHTPWEPSESNRDFASRTANECVSNMKYWCEEMRLTAAEIEFPDIQANALKIVDTACDNS